MAEPSPTPAEQFAAWFEAIEGREAPWILPTDPAGTTQEADPA